jgi:hypothetical protein
MAASSVEPSERVIAEGVEELGYPGSQMFKTFHVSLDTSEEEVFNELSQRVLSFLATPFLDTGVQANEDYITMIWDKDQGWMDEALETFQSAIESRRRDMSWSGNEPAKRVDKCKCIFLERVIGDMDGLTRKYGEANLTMYNMDRLVTFLKKFPMIRNEILLALGKVVDSRPRVEIESDYNEFYSIPLNINPEKLKMALRESSDRIDTPPVRLFAGLIDDQVAIQFNTLLRMHNAIPSYRWIIEYGLPIVNACQYIPNMYTSKALVHWFAYGWPLGRCNELEFGVTSSPMYPAHPPIVSHQDENEQVWDITNREYQCCIPVEMMVHQRFDTRAGEYQDLRAGEVNTVYLDMWGTSEQQLISWTVEVEEVPDTNGEEANTGTDIMYYSIWFAFEGNMRFW